MRCSGAPVPFFHQNRMRLVGSKQLALPHCLSATTTVYKRLPLSVTW